MDKFYEIIGTHGNTTNYNIAYVIAKDEREADLLYCIRTGGTIKGSRNIQFIPNIDSWGKKPLIISRE
jgi:hypothetical protein